MSGKTHPILNAFQAMGLSPEKTLSRGQIADIMNQLLKSQTPQKITIETIPGEIQTQLWERTTGNQTGEVTVGEYAKTIEKAHQMLLQKIHEAIAQRTKSQNEIDRVRRLIQLAKKQNDQEEAARLVDRLRGLGLSAMKFDQDLEALRDDLKLLTVPFNMEGKDLEQNFMVENAVSEKHNTSVKSVSNHSVRDMSINQPVNISHNRSTGNRSNRSQLDTSAQRPSRINKTMLDPRNTSLPPMPLPNNRTVAEGMVPIDVQIEGAPSSMLHQPYLSPLPPPGSNPSRRLFHLLWLTGVLLILQLFIITEKPSPLGLLVALGVMSLFLLHMFSSVNVKICLAGSVVSFLLDFLWITFKLKYYLAKKTSSFDTIMTAQRTWPFEMRHYQLHMSIFIAVLFVIILKFVISAILCSLRNIQFDDVAVRVFGHDLIVSDQAVAANPHNYRQQINYECQ